FSLQNVSVWGETGTLSKSDINGTAIHEAWGEILFSDIFSIKAGRQEIIYDDHRIFGSVDWAQQGRSHDAAIFKINPNESNAIHIGVTYNALEESLYKQDYTINNYKTFQYGHYHGQFSEFGISVLALNNGKSYITDDTTASGEAKEKIAFSQTIGPRFSFKNENIQTNVCYYYQLGKIPSGTSTKNIRAMYFSFNFNLTIAKMFTIGTGIEYLSGNNEKVTSSTENAFAPLYGTNHKFNGWMDYFYVGNHFNSVGLIDIYVPLKFNKNKFSVMLIPHIFQTAGKLYRQERDDDWNLVVDENDNPVMKEFGRHLGTEIDFAIGYAFSKAVAVKAGYSRMFASESMEYLKVTQKDKANTWGWVMLVFKPTFYQSK
ncbi:MAG: alginate export family protein, partial [Bacteroidales bacterium]|nr:alginate export family protein [Bacteroidales bacterium]